MIKGWTADESYLMCPVENAAIIIDQQINKGASGSLLLTTHYFFIGTKIYTVTSSTQRQAYHKHVC